jgi:hypothetical protein
MIGNMDFTLHAEVSIVDEKHFATQTIAISPAGKV